MLRFLAPKPNGIYVDATLGTGGHFQQIGQRLNSEGFLIGIDADPTAIAFARSHLTLDVPYQLVHTNFAQLERTCYRLGKLKLDGILFDLGLSSFALENPERGFSYLHSGPLDMRFNIQEGSPAGAFLNHASFEELARVFADFGEERKAVKIARAIVAQRTIKPLETTEDLAQIVRQIVPGNTAVKSLSRIFQAVRIHVNRELAVLMEALDQALRLLAPKGRLVVIAYHSLEDRLVKQFFQREAKDCICPPGFPVCSCQHHATLKILTPKPIRPSAAEIAANPRARSACLRAVERLEVTGG